MPRSLPQDPTAAGHDSFLDVVANIVGILIILVMVVGVRAKNAPVLAVARDESYEKQVDELEREMAVEQSLRRDVLEAEDQIEKLQEASLAKHEHRQRLAMMVSAWQKKMASRREKMDAQSRQDFDLRQDVAKMEDALARLEQRRADLAAVQNAPVLIESYPTPLSRAVDGPEAHFQLRGGRVAFVPLNDLIREFKEDARHKAYRLRNQPEMTETIGPIGGFRLRYTLQRYEVPMHIWEETGRGGSYVRLKRWTLIPQSFQLGETAEAALAEGSEFRRALSQFDPRRATVTVWTYPDSYAAFRLLKKELFRLGYPTAARPLPEGHPISGSPDGTKSSAQ